MYWASLNYCGLKQFNRSPKMTPSKQLLVIRILLMTLKLASLLPSNMMFTPPICCDWPVCFLMEKSICVDPCKSDMVECPVNLSVMECSSLHLPPHYQLPDKCLPQQPLQSQTSPMQCSGSGICRTKRRKRDFAEL